MKEKNLRLNLIVVIVTRNSKRQKKIKLKTNLHSNVKFVDEDLAKRVTKHITAVHDRVKLFKCSICTFETGNKTNLKIHIDSEKNRISILRYIEKTQIISS